MACDKRFFFSAFLFVIFSTCQASTAYYDTTSNLTHTCKISPMVVCVDVEVLNKTCVDPLCLMYSGGNYTSCASSLTISRLNDTVGNTTSSENSTISNNTSVRRIFTCNGTWIYPNQTSFCFNTTSWNKTVCTQTNVTCKINSTQCSLNAVVYVGGFFNLRDKDGFGNLPATEVALDEINKDNTTLANITLSLVAKQSTQSLLSYGTQLLYNYLHSGPTKLMLLLPQESDLARTVAAYAGLKRWGTLQFSYGTTDNSLASNKELFPRFYRLNPLAITYNRLRAAFVEQFPDWKLDVGLLYYADSYYQEVNDDLNEKLKDKGINVVANVGFRSNPAEALYTLKEKNAHIIITTFPYWYGKKMFCKAFQLGMYGPHYVWITFTLLPYKFWVPKPSDNLECTEDEMNCIAENHFAFHGAALYKEGNTLISQPNNNFSHIYNELVTSTKNRTNAAPYVYDAIWTMANILERARKKYINITELSYGEKTEVLEKLANDTDFEGLTGRIRFYKNGNRKFEMSVLQVRRNGVGYIVGKYDEDKDVYTEDLKNTLWQGGWPYRRTTETRSWRYIDLALFVVWCILAVLGIIYAIFCLVFIIKYRLERSIKYSSPTINVVIILGCLLNFIAVILYGVDYQRASVSRMTIICKVRLWIFSVGFTFCIGGLWVKVWTLYQILIERKVYRKRKMEYWMFAIVMILLIIDVIYLTTWTVIDGMYRSFETVTDQPAYKCFENLPDDPFIATIWYIEICDCDNLALWSAIFLIYKTLFLLFGSYMAWKVRKVFTRKLVDAQYCAILLLLAVPFSLLGLIFAFTLRLYPTAHYGLLGIIITIYTYIVLGFLYGHKIISILCFPRNIIKVRSSDDTGNMKCCCGCCSGRIFSACCVPIAACVSTCCCVCCSFNCCKVLGDALLHGPRKNRGTFVKENEKMDYQIGDMPGDKERQLIILQKQIEKRDEELQRLRRNNRATLAVKETQTMDYLNENCQFDRSAGDGSSRSNNGFNDDDGNNKQRSSTRNNNRFKVYHRKLDFSHVGSKVDSGLENKSYAERGSIPRSENDCGQSRRGSNDSEISLLQKTLSERDKELARLKACLGMDTSSGIQVGSLSSIGEERNSITPTEYESPNRNVSSITITIQNSDSDGDSKKSGSDISNDKVPADVNKEQTEELLGETSTTEDQEKQMGILPDSLADKEKEVEENEKKEDEKRKEEKPKSKLYPGSAYGSTLAGAYISHYNAKGGGKFKKKVRQLGAFGILAQKPASEEKTTKAQADTKISSATNLDQTASVNQANISTTLKVTPNEGQKSKIVVDEDTGNPTGGNNTAGGGDTGQKSRNNVKIFNAPTNWSHVKSRLFDPNRNGQNTLKPSPNASRVSQAGIDDDIDHKSSETFLNASSNTRPNSKVGIDEAGVKLFNSSTDYSHVKSRLFDPNASGNQSENLLKPSPNTRRKSKVGIEDDNYNKTGENISGEGNGEKRRNGVKIFNSSQDYSHVKSRLFDPNANQVNSENLLKPSPSIRRKSKVGINDDANDDIDSDKLSKRPGSVKIFNSSLDFSHVKSRLFESDGPSSSRSSQVNQQDINDTANKQEHEVGEEKENHALKSRSNVKIFNAPSDYSHIKSRLHHSSHEDNVNDDNKFKRKVQQKTNFGAVAKAEHNQNKNTNNKEQSTSV